MNREILADSSAIATRAVELFVRDIRAVIDSGGSPVWIAAGGTTPALAYDILASDYRDDALWGDVAIAMGDERCVPLDDAESNWRQLHDRLLSKVGVDPSLLAVPLGEGSAEDRAAEYSKRLDELCRRRSGLFHITHAWVGMGEDGHTLSLFPNHPSNEDTSAHVVPVHNSPKPPPDRISLSRTAMRACEHLVVLAAGAGKKEAIAQALAPGSDLPIASLVSTVMNGGGRVSWLLDEAAAQLL